VAVQHMQRCFVRAVVIAQVVPGGEGEQCLAQVMLLTAVDGARSGRCWLQGRDDVFTGERGER
jgi:hypothetical protein